MVLAYGRSAPKSVMARCKGREQPRALTPALLAKGRIRLLAVRYWGSWTVMAPKVVCQLSFFYLRGEHVRCVALLAQSAQSGPVPKPAWPLGLGV